MSPRDTAGIEIELSERETDAARAIAAVRPSIAAWWRTRVWALAPKPRRWIAAAIRIVRNHFNRRNPT